MHLVATDTWFPLTSYYWQLHPWIWELISKCFAIFLSFSITSKYMQHLNLYENSCSFICTWTVAATAIPRPWGLWLQTTTVMILSFRTGLGKQCSHPDQTAPDQGQHRLQFRIFGTHYSMVKPHCSNFRVITANFLGVRIFRIFMVLHHWDADANRADCNPNSHIINLILTRLSVLGKVVGQPALLMLPPLFLMLILA